MEGAHGPWIPETICQPWPKYFRGVTFGAQCSEYQILIPSYPLAFSLDCGQLEALSSFANNKFHGGKMCL